MTTQVLVYKSAIGRRLRKIEQAELDTLGPIRLGNRLYSTLLTNGFGQGTLLINKSSHSHTADSPTPTLGA